MPSSPLAKPAACRYQGILGLFILNQSPELACRCTKAQVRMTTGGSVFLQDLYALVALLLDLHQSLEAPFTLDAAFAAAAAP